MTKAISSAVDFLAAVSGAPQTFEVEGVTVELQSLTFAESQQLSKQYGDDSTEMTFQALVLGLVSPKLTEEQIKQLREARPGPLMKMARRVMVISGMLEDDGPLVPGGGS